MSRKSNAGRARSKVCPPVTAAFLGETERGSIKPTLVTSYKDYQRSFGGVFDQNKFMPYAVSGFFENGGKRLFVCRIVDAGAKAALATFGNFILTAVGPGEWGNRVYAKIEDNGTTRPDGAGGVLSVGFRLRLAYYSSPPAQDPSAWFDNPSKPPRPVYSEDFDDLVIDENSLDFFEKRLLNGSSLAMLERSPNAASGDLPEKAMHQLQNGSDGTLPLDPADFRGGLDNGERAEIQGLESLKLDPFREVSLVYAPGVSFDISKDVITHCEDLRYRFAVVDSEETNNVLTFEPRNEVADTKYAALYYPWIWISDPQTGARKLVPPGGHTLGIFVRSNSERGVFKAPANEIVRGALDLQVETDDNTQDIFEYKGRKSDPPVSRPWHSSVGRSYS